MNKSELKRKYKLLKQKGKDTDADTLLKKIQSMDKNENDETVLPKKDSLDSLASIKGIGIETVNDLKRIYNSVDDLKKALDKNKVPLRNDLVSKIKKYFGYSQ